MTDDPKCGTCGQRYSTPNRLRLAEAENDALRRVLATSAADCVYCGLAAVDMGACRSGFPGCARADDLLIDESAERVDDLLESVQESRDPAATERR